MSEFTAGGVAVRLAPLARCLTAFAARPAVRREPPARQFHLRLLAFLLLLGAVYSAQAGTDVCSDPLYKPPADNVGVVDGNSPQVQALLPSSSFTIDTNCQFKNFLLSSTWPDGLTPTLNFKTPATGTKPVYLITFDKVFYSGNLACSAINHKLWVVNSPKVQNGRVNGLFDQTCQELFIPAEQITKATPGPYATVGVPFTYTLTLPSMMTGIDANGNVTYGPSPNDLGDVVLTDNLDATGVALTLVGTPVVTWVGSGLPVAHTFTQSTAKGGLLTFNLPNVLHGQQIKIEITVVLDDVPSNAVGTTFINTAEWSFARAIDLDGNNIIEDGTADLDGDGLFEDEYFNPLPGESGVSAPMTIAEPTLVVMKTGPDVLGGLNLGEWGEFTIEAKNTGLTDAWSVTILDRLPSEPSNIAQISNGGMCDMTPEVTAVRIVAADGVTSRTLLQDSGYSLSYTGPPTCELNLALSETAGPVGPNERLVIDYRTKLDADSDNGAMLTNVAAATWFNGTSASTARQTYTCTPTDGTVGTADCQDAHDVMVVLSGYFFEKTVENLTTGENPTTGAAPGDRLRYTLRVQSTSEAMSNIAIRDVLDSAFDWSTLAVIAPAGVTFTTDATARAIDIHIASLAAYSEISIQFEVTLGTTLTAGMVVSNQASLSANGGPSTLSDDPNVNGQANPAVVGDEDPTRVVIYQPMAPTAPLKEALQPTATIGEDVTYRITVPGTPRNRVTDDVVVSDTLDPSITFVSASATLNGVPLALTTNQSGQDLSWNLGTIPAGQQVIITLVTRVVNSDATNAGDIFTNTVTYIHRGAAQALASAPAEVTIVEPAVAISKAVTPNLPPTAGDVLHYTVNLLATSDVNTSSAYDLGLVDALGVGLKYEPGTAQVSGVAVEPVVTPGDGVTTSEILTWAGLDITKGTSVAVTYDVRVQDSVVVGQTLTNTATARWTSLDDAFDFERTGTESPPYNDYFTSASTSLTTADNTTLSKVLLTDTYGPLGVRVGDFIDYELRVGLQEGSHTGLVLTDTLPVGFQFVSVVSASYFGAPMATPPVPTQSGQTVTWTLGDVVNNTADNDPANDYVVIVYRVRVMNEDTLAQLPTSQDLRNDATLDYTVGGAAAPRLTATQTSTVKQPLLSVSKTAAPAGGDTLIVAGEDITYTVDITNSGDAPAYDAVLVDTLPVGLRQAGLTVTGITLVNAGTNLTPLSPAFDPATGVATWNFDTGVAEEYTIPAGETLRVVYRVKADAAVGTGLTLTNAAQVTVYYSFDDEAVPTYGTTGEREVYGPTNTANQTLITPTPNAPSKVNGQPTATIGEQFTYRITVPATPASTALYDVRILDDLSLSSADLRFVSATVVQGSTWTLSNTSGSDTNLVLEDTATGIDIPAGGQAVIEVTVELLNSPANNRGLAFTNTASYTYNQTDGAVASQVAGGAGVTAPMRVVEPVLTASKTVRNVTAGKAATDPVSAGDILEYVVTIPNGGDSTARDLNVVDTLPPGLQWVVGSTTATINGVPVAGFIATPATLANGALNWGRENGDGSLDIPAIAGEPLVLTYRVNVLTASGASISNSVYVDWTSLEGASTAERTGAGCPAITAPNDYCVGPATATITVTDTNAVAKSVVSDTWDAGASTAGDAILRVGDSAVYRLAITLREGQTQNVVVTDTLPAGLAFEGVVRVNGDTAAPFRATAPFSHADIAAPSVVGGTITWNLGDIINTSSNGTDDVFVIEYRARVMNDDALAQSPTTQALANGVMLSYTGADPAAARLTSNATVSVRQPMLAVSKTAAPAGGDTLVEAGEVITYTVELTNSGDAPAYDTVLVDTLPIGLRQGGVTTMSIVRFDTATGTTTANLATFAPVYSPVTGIATWTFDSGVADQYTIPTGETLRVVYQVMADPDLGPGLTLTNVAQAMRYYSFDDEAVPAGGNATQREVYGPSNADSVQLTTPRPGALLKENTQPTAAIGEQFKYRITVPATPVNTALHDVRILDDLSASAADLRFVSVAKVSGSGTWTPINTGTNTNLVIEDTVSGIDIPAGEQVVVEITVELLNTPTNTVGLTFTNTADYTYNQIANTPASQTNGLPGTTAPMQIVALNAQKTVVIDIDSNGNGLVDPGDVLLYTITVNNPGVLPATGVLLTDDVPANTTYVANSVLLNGQPVGQPDGGVSPLVAGAAINSPGSASGVIASRSSAVITFKVQVNAGVPAGTVISNQGYVTSNELPTEPTDADGDPGNGHQPTTVVVGSSQQLMITKEVFVVGGGAALPGSQLEYVVRVSNTGATTATSVEVTDDLGALSGQATYVAGSATLIGPGVLVTGAGTNPVLTASVGDLGAGASVILRFRVQIDGGLPIGTRLTNTAQATWNTPTLTATASASIDIGGTMGTAMLNGHLWHDANFDNVHDGAERHLAGWNIALYRNNVQIASTTADANGLYSFAGLEPTLTTAGQYELRFTAPGAGANTAKLGLADSAFTNGMQRISGITAQSGSNLQNLNLPIDPNGVVFDSMVRSPITGATLTLLHDGAPVDSSCFDDPAQQNQVTLASGYYKFDLNYGHVSCPQGGSYVVRVSPPASGYLAGPSRVIPPLTTDQTAAYDVPACSADAVAAPAGYCEAQASENAPAASLPASQVNHYLHLTLSNPLPTDSQLFNNHIAVDPTLENTLTITKTSALVNVSRGQLVPYTITVNNSLGVDLTAMRLVDTFPPGFKYVAGSSRVNGQALEPANTNGQLTWNNLQLGNGTPVTIKLVFIVGSGVAEGEYVNRAQVFHPDLGAASGVAAATVRVTPDATFDCTDIIGKVYDDANANGYLDDGETGVPGARVVSARGLIATTDEHGRFHITCAAIPNEDRGSNFILKLDDHSLPSGYRITTENPRVERLTRGKMAKFNFGATIHRVVRLDVADGVFEENSTQMRPQWASRVGLLLEELRKGPAVLRLSYLADVEDASLVTARVNALKRDISDRWAELDCCYVLKTETEIFWRRGAPSQGRNVD